ncbi:MAG: glycerol-3-phosphate dehydrogenase/oxidase [Flavobacteriales bacterium]|nr:glycerol-3-phosphate dehydrogenase/oxidase [Flavobacteriales bacterium]
MDRQQQIAQLRSDQFDVLIIGGGITGVGIALDARARGLNTALIEMNDFASGTSSKSTKLIHGGLRYLKQFEFGLVGEVGRERAVVHRIAPHLVHPDKMLLPLIKGGNYGKWLTSLGLKIYDWLAEVRGSDRRRMLSRSETANAEPLLRTDILEGGGLYAEYRTDDSRLVVSVARTAARMGALVVNYLSACEFSYSQGKVSGVVARDEISGEEVRIDAKCVVNATGPWVDELRSKEGELSGKRLHLTKGVHLVVSRNKLPLKQTVYFDNQDGRMIFAVPRGRAVYLGTTDTDFTGDKSSISASGEDVEYILSACNHMFPNAHLAPTDVESSWAGVRPLIHEDGKNASALSRKDELFESPTGLISIAGGKLTGYRKMAERVVDRVVKRLGAPFGKCTTDRIQLVGGEFANYEEVGALIDALYRDYSQLITERSTAEYLVHNYGTESRSILESATRLNESPEVALALAEAEFTIDHEMVVHGLDYFERRTGRLNFNVPGIPKIRERVLQLMAQKLNWTRERLQWEENALDQALKRTKSFS